ncbi:hypothetical protein HCN44_008564 [Aphidius gifuensis]|uniref:Gustatory receptor n=2 Tax=Aphidius gifuensis TaxID=684658 RepID=A0A834XQR3_APHGI|nr:hypothetical protein HCN44_008564 [Aphidius gifuensis]
MISSQPVTDYFSATWQECFKILHSQSDIFTLENFDFNLWGNIFLFIVSNYATFIWNFSDLFVMLVATGLAERYKSLNYETINLIEKSHCTIHWSRLRENYCSLSWLVKQTDELISPLILISLGHNLYFSCLQLSYGLSINTNVDLSAVFPFITFAFVLGRTMAVTFLTARIHDHSREALPAVYSCSSSYFTIEIQRLQQQLTSDEISLTGMKFFSITRSFILTIAGAIVTYEIILLQMNIARK